MPGSGGGQAGTVRAGAMASSSTQPARVQFPENDVAPLGRILQRFALAIALIVLVALLAYFGRDGYVDAAEDGITLIDAFYYSTVSITTTGYGDVRPESQGARLLTTLIVTPARILFLIMLVGTTLEVLAARTRTAYRITNWRSRLSNHVVICGYGTKGRNAAIAMLERGRTREQIVVIDGRPEARAVATADGFVAVAGDASRGDVLDQAGVDRADAVVVAADRDDAAVLITLTVRRRNSHAAVIAAVREAENVPLLHQSGATSVIESSSAAGRLLGLATQRPRLAGILEDLLSVGQGLDLEEREAKPEEIGPLSALATVHPVVAVIRGSKVLRFDDHEAAEVRAGDKLVFLCAA